jgi:hypothetical protein
LNANLVRGTAVVGINVVYDYLPVEQQKSVAIAIATHFLKSVKNCSVTRSTTKETENAFGAELSYNLSLSLLQIKGKEFTDDVVISGASLETQVTIPPDKLVPEITKHLHCPTTADRAVRAVASSLALESVCGKQNFAVAVYLYDHDQTVLPDMLKLLERSGSDRKTLFVQEQAARSLFYLTHSLTISALMRKHSELQSSSSMSSGYHVNGGDVATNTESTKDKEQMKYGSVVSLDIHRAIRSMIDHSSNSKNPNLQRWSAACIKNLVLEDQRRACMTVNDVAALVAWSLPVKKLLLSSTNPVWTKWSIPGES